MLLKLESLKQSSQQTLELLTKYLDQNENLVKKSVIEKIGAVMGEVQRTTLVSLDLIDRIDNGPSGGRENSSTISSLQAVVDSGMLKKILEVYSDQLVEAVKGKMK